MAQTETNQLGYSFFFLLRYKRTTEPATPHRISSCTPTHLCTLYEDVEVLSVQARPQKQRFIFAL